MAHRTLVVLLLVLAVGYMDRQLVAILIEPIRLELGMTDAAAGLLYGFAFAVFYSFLGIPIARLADRSNRSRIITLSLVVFSAMTAMSAWASTYWQLMLARIGVGFGEAGTSPPSHSIIADLYPIERRGTAMAVFAMGLHLGILLGFLVGGFIGQALGWRAAFLIAGVTGLLMAAIAAWLMEEPPRAKTDYARPTQQTSVVQAVRVLGRSASVRHLFAGGTVANIGTTALLAWLPALIMRSHHLPLSTTGALLAFVVGVLGGGGTLLGGSLADRLGARDPAWRLRVVVVGLLVAAPCWMFAILSGNTAVALSAFMLGGALIGFHVGPSYAMVQALAPTDMRALAASLLIFLVNFIGVGLGPLLVGLLSDTGFSNHGADSLRFALLIVPLLFVWAAVHYEAAARTLAANLDQLATDAETKPTDSIPLNAASASLR